MAIRFTFADAGWSIWCWARSSPAGRVRFREAGAATMTEKQWLRKTGDWDLFYDMCRWLGERRTPRRKHRLWGCACCYRLGELMPDPRSLRAVETSERYADGAADKAE